MGSNPSIWMPAFALALAVVACASSRQESSYAQRVPPELRPSWDLFAQRCSKCHSLSRPLDSGIDDDEYWAIYVRRMRLQPGSGISLQDEATILDFLRWYAKERRERRRGGASASGASDASAPDATAPPASPEAAALDGGNP